jgi:O-antigen/teichoic acid export membrane protein
MRLNSIYKVFRVGDINQRTLNIYKNIAKSMFYKILSIAISLVLVPLTLHYVDTTQYGIWITMSSILTWFNFFDMGLGNGLRNKLAEAIAKGDNKLAKIYISTTYAILSIVIFIVLIIFIVINSFLDWSVILNAPHSYASELSRLALIVFVFFCFQFILQLINIVLTADQHPAKAAFFNLIGSLFSLLVIFILIKTTAGSLLYLGVTFSLAPLVVLAASSLWFYSREYKKIAPSFKQVDFSYTKGLMNLGVKFFIIQIAAIIIYQTSNIIISQISGPQDVTVFNISYRYFGVVTMGFSIIMTPYWSAFTEAYSKNDFSWMKKTVKKLKKLWVLLAIGVFLMVAVSNYAYHLWVGNKIIVPFSLSVLIGIYVTINAWCSIFSYILNGLGKVKIQLFSAILGGILNIPLAIFLGKQMGGGGVILSSVIIGMISALWSPYQVYLLLHQKAKGIWNG